MQSIRQVARLNETELEKVIPPNASWHTDYRDTAYIYIGGLPFELSEGDVLSIFSQYGNPVHVNLVRDKETGKSRGFAFLKYEDQRSCDLAVDNLSGAGVMGRVVSVDHTRYKRREGEVEGIGEEEGEEDGGVDEDGGEGEDGGRRKRRRTGDAVEEKERPLLRQEVELAKLLREHDDEDPMKEYLVREKRAEVEAALKVVAIRKANRPTERKGRGKPRKEERDEYGNSKVDGHRSRRREADDVDVRARRHSPDTQRTRHRHRSPRGGSRGSDEETERDRRRRAHGDSADYDDRRRRDEERDRNGDHTHDRRSAARRPRTRD